ncbi:MAG: MATE family efflux transporter [Ruminococcaceae bacterium]|nr:MATE family efflux transporter [Oscillospiraceae bacterium]
MKRYQKSMLQGPLLPNIITYTIPIILTSVLQLLFNAADLVVVGQFCGSVSVAAVGATGAITNLVVNLFIGLSIGAGISAAHAIGSKDEQTTHRIVHTAVPTALASGLFLTIVGIALTPVLLQGMGTPEEVLPLSTIYMQIYFGGMTFNMVYNFCAAILRAAGDTKSPLLFLTISGVLNVLLNLLFVTVFRLDVAGVALATTISQGVSAALVVWALMRRQDACRLELKKLRFYKQQLLKIISQGLPAGIQGAMFSISNVVIQSSVNSFGETMMSGNAAASNIEGFVYVSMDAFTQAAVNFTGQNVGARQYGRVKKILGVCVACAMTVGIVMGGGIYLLGEQLLPIYITDAQQAITYGMLHLQYVCLLYCLFAPTNVLSGVLRGMGSSLTPMLISVLGICGFRIVWIYTVFRAYHTPDCLFLSYPVSWVLTALVLLVAFIIIYRRRLTMNIERKN